jgi:hypothetical protein
MSETSLSVAADLKRRSPRIMALAWGKIEVEGIGTFRDAKLFPGGAKEWDTGARRGRNTRLAFSPRMYASY